MQDCGNELEVERESFLLLRLRFPGSIGGSVRTCEHDGVAIRIAQPDFPVVGAAIVIGRIAMAGKNDFCLQLCSASDGGIEIINLEPQKHSVARHDTWIADATVMMLHIPVMQLKNKPPVRDEPLVIRPAVITATAEQLLIPAAARFDIARANQRLRSHFVRLF